MIWLATPARRASLLIVIAGLAAIVASLALTFIARGRMAAENTLATVRSAQARMMLQAACSYVMECSRIGWDDPLTAAHEEAFGWVDVRDGQVGPKTLDYNSDGAFDHLWSAALTEDGNGDGAADRPAWPAIGSVVRCPMEVLRLPPYAISPDITPNRISNNPADAHFGLPFLRNPDPQPAIPGMTWNEFRAGIPDIFAHSRNLAWFRIHRDGPATFVVTCGAGATQGYRDWPEVIGDNATARFANDRSLFEKEILANEMRLWYRIEWSPAVTPGVDVSGAADIARWSTLSNASSHRATAPWTSLRSHGGTIQWIQRLRHPPNIW